MGKRKARKKILKRKQVAPRSKKVTKSKRSRQSIDNISGRGPAIDKVVTLI